MPTSLWVDTIDETSDRDWNGEDAAINMDFYSYDSWRLNAQVCERRRFSIELYFDVALWKKHQHWLLI